MIRNKLYKEEQQMKQIYRNALSEVNAILINSNQNIINMIPNKFLDFVRNNMNQAYEIQIDLGKGILEQNISNEAKSIVALIYRDYICSADERQVLIKKELVEKLNKEKMKNEKYRINWNKKTLQLVLLYKYKNVQESVNKYI